MRRLLTPLLIALTTLTAACGPQSFVEGETAAMPFSVVDPDPAHRARAHDTLVMLTEEKGEELALVSISIPEGERLPLGEPLDIAEIGVEIEAAIGELEVIERTDGARILNAKDPTFFPARAGTFTLDSRDPLAGSFTVDVDDGELTGAFVLR